MGNEFLAFMAALQPHAKTNNFFDTSTLKTWRDDL